jgi:hypothetical protein
MIGFLVACSAPSAPPPAQPIQPTQPTPVQPPAAQATGEEKFTGTLTEVRFGCAADGSCDAVVDGTKTVHFGHDTRAQGPTTWGNTEEIFELMEDPKHGAGRRVEVFAKKVEDGYTLQGSEAYYIKVLPK